MIPKSKVWYPLRMARECKILSCYALKLRLINDEIYDGYYYCGRFYVGQEEVTDFLVEWMIPYEGESVSAN